MAWVYEFYKGVVGVNGMIEVRDSVSGSTYSDKSEGYVFGSLVLK